jgi:hypothetical protein
MIVFQKILEPETWLESFPLAWLPHFLVPSNNLYIWAQEKDKSIIIECKNPLYGTDLSNLFHFVFKT